MNKAALVYRPTGISNVPTTEIRSSKSFSEVYFVLLALVSPILSNIKHVGTTSVDYVPIPTVNLVAGKNYAYEPISMYTGIDINQNVVNMNNEQTIRNTTDIENIKQILERMEGKIDQLPNKDTVSLMISNENSKLELRIKDDINAKWQNINTKVLWILWGIIISFIGFILNFIVNNFGKFIQVFSGN